MQPNRYAFFTAVSLLLVAAVGLWLIPSSRKPEDSTQPSPVAQRQQPEPQRRRFQVKYLPAKQVAQSVRTVCEMRLHSVTVDENTNVISVTAPPRILDDVARLISVIDESATDTRQTTHVVTLRNADPRKIEMALTRIFGAQTVAANETSLR